MPSYNTDNIDDTGTALIPNANAGSYNIPGTDVPYRNDRQANDTYSVSPAVITSAPATADLNKIKTSVSDITTGMQTQSDRIAAEAAATKAEQQKAFADQTAADQKAEELRIKNAALNDGADTSITEPVQTPQDIALAQAEETYFAEAENVSKTIKNIQNGTVPLTAGEQAQLTGLQQQFQDLIDEQKLTNKGNQGLANIRGYQTGSAEYDPTFQVKTIGTIVTAGLKKVATLNIQMAAAVASLTQGFKDNKISAIKDAWNVYNDASAKRTATLQKTVDRANKLIDDARTQKLALEKENRDNALKLEGDINSVAAEAAKNGAPISVLSKIGTAKTVNEALMAAGKFSRDPLDVAYKTAQINKIYQDIADAKAANANIGDPNEIIAYAHQYASTGTIPSGMPKGTFGVVAQVAKELPKEKGQIIDINTGISPAGNTALTTAMGNLSSVIELGKQLKQLDEDRWGGLVAGATGKVFGSDAQARYIDLRTQMVDLLARARSGAALTTTEEERYTGMLPGRFSNTFGLGVDSQVKIDNFINNLSADLTNKAKTQGWSVYGVSKVNTPLGEKTVGDTLQAPNGLTGRVNADGSITEL